MVAAHSTVESPASPALCAGVGAAAVLCPCPSPAGGSLVVVMNRREWANVACTTRRVDALKRGLHVVRVSVLPVESANTAVSLGDTTKLLVTS